MSQENAEVVRAVTEAAKTPEAVERAARGDLDSTFVDPEIEWDATGARDLVPDLADVYIGHEGVRTYWRRWLRLGETSSSTFRTTWTRATMSWC
jgi:hypothetical protein